MNVFEYAMQMEKDGEAYYREGAEKATAAGNKGLAAILTFLADEEVKHYNIFSKLNEGKADSLPPSNLLDSVKNIFVEMKDAGQTFTFEGDAEKYYLQAQKVEKDSEDFYREKAKETKVVHEKDLLNKIADEEARHYRLMGNLAEFVKRPDNWLENAEWNNMEDY